MELNVTYDTLHSLANRLMYDQRSFAELLPEAATFWLAWTFSAEVQNGGLHQFFYNHSGDFAHGTIDALREVHGSKKIINFSVCTRYKKLLDCFRKVTEVTTKNVFDYEV